MCKDASGTTTSVPDTEQEFHCCICPIDEVLRDTLKHLIPDPDTERIHHNLLTTGLVDTSHENVHVMGTDERKIMIDSVFFPWSSTVNLIEEGDLGREKRGYWPPRQRQVT